MSNQELQTIDPAALAQVSGGTTVTTSSSASSDQILTALNGILSSLQGMTQPNSGGFNQQEMMMLMMIMQQRNQQQVIAGNPWASWGQSPIYYY
ncbi:MAG TPA: hypothetical protein VHW23_16430 [Kofleriaceae bacterium]|jgi:hypothetical protein|nr:hypothetical protein [Kofleriaceae bacterium]